MEIGPQFHEIMSSLGDPKPLERKQAAQSMKEAAERVKYHHFMLFSKMSPENQDKFYKAWTPYVHPWAAEAKQRARQIESGEDEKNFDGPYDPVSHASKYVQEASRLVKHMNNHATQLLGG